MTVPPPLASAYETLMSAREELAVGTSCDEGGEPPAGAKEIGALTKAKRTDLLRNVLRGPNPEARVYALQALQKLGALDADDRQVAERFKALPIGVESCLGRLYSKGTLAEALRALE